MVAIVHGLHEEVPGLYAPVHAFRALEVDPEVLVLGQLEAAEAVDVVGQPPAALVLGKGEGRRKAVLRQGKRQGDEHQGLLHEVGYGLKAAGQLLVGDRPRCRGRVCILDLQLGLLHGSGIVEVLPREEGHAVGRQLELVGPLRLIGREQDLEAAVVLKLDAAVVDGIHHPLGGGAVGLAAVQGKGEVTAVEAPAPDAVGLVRLCDRFLDLP